MRVLFQIAICICLIILAGGTISYIHDDPSFGGGFLLICVWGGLISLVDTTKKQFFNFSASGKKPDLNEPSSERITQLERRLTDIQDIVITIDEKLSRIERQSIEPSKNDAE